MRTRPKPPTIATARRHSRSIAALALVACGVAAAPAAAASTESPAPTRSCSVLLEPIKPGETFSRVVKEVCADTIEKADQAALGGTRTAAEATLLLEAADNINQGLPRYRWWGYSGPCDTAGYGIRDLGVMWNDRISSWRQGHSRCNYLNVWEHNSYQGAKRYWHNWTKVDYVGDAWNDRISSMHIHYEP
ncbi:hypothetical protein ACIBF7_21850 [Nonomuraea sp. NPDC050478]|uniref:hypothetical protein n=1 Tax=unclassified Nonomuraea TaxID=2593643 RepID=UPI0011CE5341|nr:hypothetical protein [Nonomuraea sp. C10]TXK42417.1 hypothetical protein FR742_25140 [Nonomuraea sp. C10]